MSLQVRIPLLVCFLPIFMVSSVRAGPDWPEMNAGPVISSGEKVKKLCKNIQLFVIQGDLSATGPKAEVADFEDLYLIRISDPDQFSASTDSAMGDCAPDPYGCATTAFDSHLWLFRLDGKGLLANDNKPGAMNSVASRIGAVANDSCSVTGGTTPIPGPGLYALAISGSGRRPTSVGGDIFSISCTSEVSSADGTGSASALSGWTGTGPGTLGDYRIVLKGAEAFNAEACPALSPLGLRFLTVTLAVGGAVLFKRHARRLTESSGATR